MIIDPVLIKHFEELKVKFTRPQLLATVFIHRSYLNEQRKLLNSNERLEYLGDAVLELITSDFLFHRFPNKPEGKLTNLRAKIVQTKTLSFVAQQLQLGRFLKFSKGEAASGGAKNPSILADTFEALVGAIYLDQGLVKAQAFVKTHLLKNFNDLINKTDIQDWKSQLQEKIQAQKGPSPTYTLVKTKGPDHDREFTIAVHFFNKEQARGTAKSKQSAEQQAAKKALEKLKKSQ